MIVTLARPPRCSLYTSNSSSAMADSTMRTSAVRIQENEQKDFSEVTRECVTELCTSWCVHSCTES